MKDDFRGGPPLYACPGLITGPALVWSQGMDFGQAEGLALGQAQGQEWAI